MSTLLMAVEIAKCFDNDGGEVVCGSVNHVGWCVEKWRPWGVWALVVSRSTVKMELGRIDGEGREAVNCANNGGGSGQPQTC